MMMRRAWLTSLGADLPSRLFSSPSAWQISWGGDGKKTDDSQLLGCLIFGPIWFAWKTHINFPGKQSTYTRKNLSLFMGTYQHLNFLAVFMPEYTT